MNLFIRLLRLKLFGRFRPRAGLTGPTWTPFRVLPTDLNVYRTMHSGVYLSLLDIARLDLLERTGLARPFRKRGWRTEITSESIGFGRPLKLFQRFEVETRILGWVGDSFYVHQRFVRDGDVVAAALVLGRVRDAGDDTVPAADVAALARIGEPPPVPDWALRMGGDHDALRRNRLG